MNCHHKHFIIILSKIEKNLRKLSLCSCTFSKFTYFQSWRRALVGEVIDIVIPFKKIIYKQIA